MNYKKRRLGEFIVEIDNRNTDMVTNNLIGVSISKEFIPSVANVIGTDLSKYKIIREGQFACSLMQVSRDGGIAASLYKSCCPSIMSPAYHLFKVNSPEMDSCYLEMVMRSPEFDRAAVFYAVGGVRGTLTWEEFCDMQISVPPIEEQRKIVRQYKTLQTRSDVLHETEKSFEAIVQTMFDEMFMKDDNKTGTINDLAYVNPTRKLSKNMVANCFEMACLPTSGCILGEGERKAYSGGTRFANGDTLIARITPCLENGKAAFVNCLKNGEVAFGSTEYIVFEPKTNIPAEFLYFLIRNKQFVTFARQFMNGTSGRQRVSGEELASFKIGLPFQADLDKFGKLANAFSRFALFCERERRCLQNEMNLMLRAMRKNA